MQLNDLRQALGAGESQDWIGVLPQVGFDGRSIGEDRGADFAVREVNEKGGATAGL